MIQILKLNTSTKYWYLDLHPEKRVQNGHNWSRKALLNWGPQRCFAQSDLYTSKWGEIESTEIEQFFFGDLDNKGKSAVELYSKFDMNDRTVDAFNDFVLYLSVQKLRTPKGLGLLRAISKTDNQNLSVQPETN